MSKLRSTWKFICRHKYAVAILVFIVVVGVFDTNSYYHRYQLHQETEQLTSEINHYKSQCDRDTRLLKEIDANPRAMEKIAREHYFMKKPNEDVYIIKEK